MRSDPVEIAGLWFGLFTEITALNRRFIPGHPRLKLTVDLNLTERKPGASPALFLASLERLLPSLGRHSCCGHARIDETFFGRSDGSPSRFHEADTRHQPDDAVDIAHLLEHLIIDFQHGIADMRACSGITCGHKTPITRYDLFIETPDERVGRVCVALACNLMNEMLLGGDPSPVYATILRLARHVFLSDGAAFTTSQSTAALGGDRHAADALVSLLAAGFVKEIPMAINFSRVPLYGFNPIGDGS